MKQLFILLSSIVLLGCAGDDVSTTNPTQQQPTNPVSNRKNLSVKADQSTVAPNHIKIYKKLENGTYEQLNEGQTSDTTPTAWVSVGDIIKISYAIGNDNATTCIKYTYDNVNYSPRYCLQDNKAYSTFVEFTVE